MSNFFDAQFWGSFIAITIIVFFLIPYGKDKDDND